MSNNWNIHTHLFFVFIFQYGIVIHIRITACLNSQKQLPKLILYIYLTNNLQTPVRIPFFAIPLDTHQFQTLCCMSAWPPPWADVPSPVHCCQSKSAAVTSHVYPFWSDQPGNVDSHLHEAQVHDHCILTINEDKNIICFVNSKLFSSIRVI